MTSSRDRLMDLLTDRALVGLGQREQIELAELLVKVQDVDIAAFDKAAAAIALATISPLEPMPNDLADRIEQRAMTAIGTNGARPASDFASTRELDKLSPGFAQTQTAEVSDRDFTRTQTMDERPQKISTEPRAFTPTTPPVVPTAQPPVSYAPPFSSGPAPAPAPSSFAPAPPSNVITFRAPTPKAARAPSRALAIGGWVAAAACFLLALGAFAFRSTPPPVVTLPVPLPTPTNTAAPIPSAAPSQTPAELREQLLAANGTARAEWSPTKDPAGKTATGEVVWNKDQQKGTMRFRGLAKNDPSRAQYQLWIFDKTRDDKYPVDGGVFDVDSETGDVVVPIHATLPVNAPVLFAVTLEKPGGVVVSKRERIVVTAKLTAG